MKSFARESESIKKDQVKFLELKKIQYLDLAFTYDRETDTELVLPLIINIVYKVDEVYKALGNREPKLIPEKET